MIAMDDTCEATPNLHAKGCSSAPLAKKGVGSNKRTAEAVSGGSAWPKRVKLPSDFSPPVAKLREGHLFKLWRR